VNGYRVEVVAERLAVLSAGLAALAAERQEHETAWQQRRLAIADSCRKRAAAARSELATVDPAAEVEAAVTQARNTRERRLELVTAAGVRLRRVAREELDRQLAQERAAADAAARRRMNQNSGRRDEVLRQLAGLRQRAQVIEAEVHRQAQRAGVTLVEAEQRAAPEIPDGTDAARAAAGLSGQLDNLELILPRTVGTVGAMCCRTGGRVVLHVLALLPAVGLYAAEPSMGMLPLAGGVLAAGQVGGLVATAMLRRRLAQRLTFLRDALADLAARCAALESLSGGQVGAAVQPSLDRVLREGELSEDQQRAVRAAAERRLASIRDREARLRTRIERSGTAHEAAVRSRVQADAGARHAALASRVAAAEAAAKTDVDAADLSWHAERDRITAAATTLVAAIAQDAGAAAAQCASEHPAWDDPCWPAWKPGLSWPAAIPLGRAVSSLAGIIERAPAAGLGLADAEIAVPLALGFPAAANLLLRCLPERRTAAVDILSQTLLRSLVASPAGRLKLTLIDPVGLGQSFAPLLALADQGEAILPGGVATDDTRIERALDDLCAHLEAVIRTRLRGRYETIADYNREAGDLQEPIRLVAIADFPAGFGERAMERLAVLLRTGTRCGVHILLHHDQRQRLPPAVDAALIQHAAVVLRDSESGLVPDHPALRGWSFIPAALPAPAQAARLATAAGAAAVRANRVELAFAGVAPPAEQVWSLSSASSLRVPIGMRGAGQVQYMELGRGTAQHVLIGGRTGSGKSTLLHVLVTSAALWFHPRELEVHLIDFKKGVEFQAYATHHLPHARVIAVESDREFGLSVLRRLDAELARRGDVFRAAGAQDLASHRKTGGEHLPRILLLIDEFQEFFTEDDTVARDAALLLDRFVRQGRAFGLHVVLGSQTLSGSYSLAKSSLGQMGVRIVLPCNEADAHLLLHEDNDATRLLTRPGEAIYNDQAGLAEGNSPFQVCWLNDDVRAGHLRAVAERCAAEGWKPSSPTVVFAGDAPARFDEDPALAELIARPLVAADRRTAAWVGQSSSLRGAAEVLFPAASGGNLLLVGQHREAANATVVSVAIGLAARHAPTDLRLIALDGEDADGPFAGLWGQLDTGLPHGARRFGGREVAGCLDALSGLLEKRASGEDASRSPVLLAVNALQRLRALRPDDDAPFASGGGEPPAERFAKLLSQGPEYGIHAAVWCDSLSGVQRSLSRRSLRDFDLRILFQMSPADSSELIDDDAASRLGLHSALLAVLGEGRREKFRPWQAPAASFIEHIGKALRVCH
jgi:DNA segregation ATPase FtsK/SpoIIIE, S-DNA-T family